MLTEGVLLKALPVDVRRPVVFTCWLSASYWLSLHVGSRRPIDCLYMLAQGVLLSVFTCWLKASYWVSLHVVSRRPIEWLYMLAQGVLLSGFTCWLRASYWVALHVGSRRPIECLYMLTQGVLLSVFTCWLKASYWLSFAFCPTSFHCILTQGLILTQCVLLGVLENRPMWFWNLCIVSCVFRRIPAFFVMMRNVLV